MLAIIGGSLIYTFDIGTSTGKFIGYQVIAGAGIGIAIQVPVIVAQATSSRPDMAVSMSTVLCEFPMLSLLQSYWPRRPDNITVFQFLAGSIGVGATQNVFDNRLITSLPTYAPDVSVTDVLNVGAYDLLGAFPNPVELLGVLQSYMQGLKAAWIFSIALSACTLLISFIARGNPLNLNRPLQLQLLRLGRALRFEPTRLPCPCNPYPIARSLERTISSHFAAVHRFDSAGRKTNPFHQRQGP